MNSYKTLGAVIDSKYEDFVEECKKLSAGEVQNLIFALSHTYADLVLRKDVILVGTDITLEEKQNTVLRIYAEMQKIEDKVTYLRKRAKELTPKR